MTLYTIGHSTRPLDEFIRILSAHGIELLVDVRSVPRSRMNPQFNRESLPEALAAAGIRYEHRRELGGLRKPRPDSQNTAWRNDSFRGYADYMETRQFANALAELIYAASECRTSILCAEAVPWQCHRSMISDAVVAAGHEVIHMLSESKAEPHRLTSFALVEDGRVCYAGAQRRLL